MEDTKTVSTIAVCVVSSETAKWFVFRTDVEISTWTNCVLLQVKPVRVPVRPSSVVVNEIVVGIGDPEGSWCLVSVKK